MEEEYHLSEEQRIQAELEKEKKRKKGIKAVKWLLISIVAIIVVFFVWKKIRDSHMMVRKPVIYLYPEQTTEVSVRLDYDGQLSCTYPIYTDAWRVTANPDGLLTGSDGTEYNYLYWEGISDVRFDWSEGFCVKGTDTAAFLEKALSELGLNRREANEFIVYWLPLMETNEYNVISFQKDSYTDIARLAISPEPDTVIRVFMAWYGSRKPVKIPKQELTAPERKGFTVVEWGGTEVRKGSRLFR